MELISPLGLELMRELNQKHYALASEVWARLEAAGLNRWAFCETLPIWLATPRSSYRLSWDDELLDWLLARYTATELREGQPGVKMLGGGERKINVCPLLSYLASPEVKPALADRLAEVFLGEQGRKGEEYSIFDPSSRSSVLGEISPAGLAWLLAAPRFESSELLQAAARDFHRAAETYAAITYVNSSWARHTSESSNLESCPLLWSVVLGCRPEVLPDPLPSISSDFDGEEQFLKQLHVDPAYAEVEIAEALLTEWEAHLVEVLKRLLSVVEARHLRPEQVERAFARVGRVSGDWTKASLPEGLNRMPIFTWLVVEWLAKRVPRFQDKVKVPQDLPEKRLALLSAAIELF